MQVEGTGREGIGRRLQPTLFHRHGSYGARTLAGTAVRLKRGRQAGSEEGEEWER